MGVGWDERGGAAFGFYLSSGLFGIYIFFSHFTVFPSPHEFIANPQKPSFLSARRGTDHLLTITCDWGKGGVTCLALALLFVPNNTLVTIATIRRVFSIDQDR